MTYSKVWFRRWGAGAGSVLIIGLLLVAPGMAGVLCDSVAVGDNVNVVTDYTEMVDTGCTQSQSAYSAMMAGGGGYDSSMDAGNGFAHITQAAVNGMFRDGMSTIQQPCDTTKPCAGSSPQGTCTYSQAMFGTHTVGKSVIQSAGYIGTGFSGQAYVTGTGSSRIHAGAIDQTDTSELTFKQNVRSSGFNHTAWMSFDWIR